MLKNSLKNKKIIFAFSDSAGAKALLSIWKLNFDLLKNSILISDRYHNFYKSFKSNVTIINKVNEIQNIVHNFNPDLLICGTSAGKFELKFIQTCLDLNIKTVSFVDHWINFLSRFQFPDKTFCFPDEIWVTDLRAKKLAIKDGLDVKKIFVVGNPYYKFLENWTPPITRSEFFKKLKLNKDYILYALEPFSVYNLKSKYGFDEFDSLKDIIESISEFNKIEIIFKCHPNHDYNLVYKRIKELDFKKNNLKIIKNISMNELIYFSSLVIGFFSNALIESSILNKKIIRLLYMLSDSKLDVFSGMNIGTEIYSSENLKHYLNNQFNNIQNETL